MPEQTAGTLEPWEDEPYRPTDKFFDWTPNDGPQYVQTDENRGPLAKTGGTGNTYRPVNGRLPRTRKQLEE